MKYGFVSMLIALLLSGCSALTEGVANGMKTESLYLRAWKTLNDSGTVTDAMASRVVTYMDEAIGIDSRDIRLYVAKGTACYYLDSFDVALENYDRALGLDSTDPGALTGKGMTYLKLEKYEQAEQSYLIALRYTKKPYKLYFDLGILYNQWKKDSIALEYFDKCVRIDPADTLVYQYRAAVRQNCHQYAAAIADMNIALTADPENVSLYNNRGLCKHNLKQYESALADFEKALSIPSTDEWYLTIKTFTYNNMANTYFALGQKEKACTYWNEAIERGYQYRPEWKEEFSIDDPAELIKLHCK
jgi:pentatricopeptide repeat protein